MNKSISVVIPARDEEKHLPQCLASLQLAAELAQVHLEIIVVLNRCTDGTQKIAEEAGCKTIFCEARNLSIIRNEGVRASSHSFICTVDADSRVSRNMFAEIIQALSDEQVVGGGVIIIPERWSVGILLTFLALLPIAFWNRISGGLFYFSRESFEAIAGFDEELVSAEDIDFAKRLRAYASSKGKVFRTLWRAKIITSCRKFDRLGDWYFITHPLLVKQLLLGKNQKAADKIWYKFKH